MNNFKVGDWVEVLDDIIAGKIINITGQGTILIETDDGFELEFESNQLVNNFNESIEINTHDLKQVKATENSLKHKKKSVKRKKVTPPLEVDLHIHNLIDATKGLTNFDMLNIQLDTARRQLEFAMNKKIQKIVFIHGVGQGVLKAELETLLSRYSNVKFYEASFKEYGAGATEVYIYQNNS